MKQNKQQFLVGVDMDNTIVQLNAGILRVMQSVKERWPDKVDAITKFMEDQKTADFPATADGEFVRSEVMNSKDFFFDLEPYPGAVTALKEMDKSGKFTILLITSATSWKYGANSCHTDKVRWVNKHLGAEWTDRVIIGKYKDLVLLDFLVDDLVQPNQFVLREPERSKCMKLLHHENPFPKWRHVLFTQSYNKHVRNQPRITDWKEWESVFAHLISEYQSVDIFFV